MTSINQILQTPFIERWYAYSDALQRSELACSVFAAGGDRGDRRSWRSVSLCPRTLGREEEAGAGSPSR